MKRIISKICLILSIVFTVNTYAAIVSDNDGSAFVTKAEFDALKNNFNVQIDSYNESIDNKIDGAIASYLAGIQIENQITTKVIFDEWKDVTCMNGVIAPEFELPNFTANVSYWLVIDYATTKSQPVSYGFNDKICCGNWKGDKRNSWATSKTIKRPLVTNNKESASDQSADMVWDGVAKRYEETYTLTRTYHENNVDLGYGDRLDAYEVTLKLINITNLLMDGGYFSNFLNAIETVVNPTIEWWKGTIGSALARYSTFTFNNDATLTRTPISINTSSVSLGADASGNTKELEHIVQWNKDTSWCVTNPTFTKTFRKHASNTKKADDLLTACTKTGRMDMMGALVADHHPTGYDYTTKKFDWTGNTDPEDKHYGYLNMQQGTQIPTETSNNTIIPSIGMLKDDQAASKIKQHDSNINYTFHKNTFAIDKPTLEKGYQLLAATKDSKIMWTPKFSSVYYYNGTSYVTNNSQKINVMFSLGPFTDKNIATSTIKVTQPGSATEKNYATIDPSGEQITFTMPANGTVYVKWWPDISDTNVQNKDWRVTLDNAASKEYTYVLPD